MSVITWAALDKMERENVARPLPDIAGSVAEAVARWSELVAEAKPILATVRKWVDWLDSKFEPAISGRTVPKETNVNWIVNVVVGLIRAGWPLPDLKNEAAVTAWLQGLCPALALAIVNTVGKYTAGGPFGAEDVDAIVAAVQAELAADEGYGKIGDGVLLKKIIAALLALLPIILPFLDEKPTA